MLELPDAIEKKIQLLSEEGNELLDEQGDWQGAVARWSKALTLLPSPQNQWDAATWLHASLGEAYLTGGKWQEARDSFHNAMNCPDGAANPFILLRLGQTRLELGDEDGAAEYLLRAYMLEGAELFDTEEPRYLELLASRGLI